MLFQIINCFKAFGTQDIFQNLTFEVKGKEKVAIVGKNGIGKTTLLDVIAGLEEMDSGEMRKDKEYQIGYLKQMVFADDGITVQEELEKCFEQIHFCERRLKELETAMAAECTDEILEKYGRLSEKFERLGGYYYETEIRTVFTKFGFQTDDLQKKIREFSGGERTRLAFVRLLLEKPDILLLDEPTNHLDIYGKEVLEKALNEFDGSIVLVSHDRYFISRTATAIIEIKDHEAVYYDMPYLDYLQKVRGEGQAVLSSDTGL